MNQEKKLKNSVEPVSISGTETILNQMKYYICKIKINAIYGTGFFCKIPFGNNITKNFLMTNYHVLSEKYYNENNKINLLINDEDITKIIDLRMNRITYFNEKYDITLIELNENDNINNFLELDDKLFKDNHEIIYENKSLYILQYPLGKNAAVSYGLLTSIDKFEIKHKCSTENGSSGSPILNLETNKVIGIHKEGSINFDFNKGTFLKYPLNDFIKKNKSNTKENTNNFSNIIFQLNNNMQNNNINFTQNNTIKNQQINEILTSGIGFPHQVGLNYIGQSKYMNATIECLRNIKILSNNLLQKYRTFDPVRQPLCLAYSNLINELLHTKEKYINPKLFKDVLEELIKGNQVADVKDLFIFIIETMHEELLPLSLTKEKEFDLSIETKSYNTEMIYFEKFMQELSRNQTIISNTFYGVIRTKKLCKISQSEDLSFKTFNLLDFSLKKIKEYKQAKIGNKLLNLDLNLNDAFLYEQDAKILKGQNMNYCKLCGKYTEVFLQKQDYYALSPILIIILNRGKNNRDFNEPFHFDEKLDFTNIVQNKNPYKKYFLAGIITQLGISGYNEHFVAYCRNNINDNFICYNDTSVTQVSVNDAMTERISGKGDKNIIPYILIYHYFI